MSIEEIIAKKKALIKTLQSLQLDYDKAIQEFEKECGVQVSGVRASHLYEAGSQWPLSIVEDVTAVLP